MPRSLLRGVFTNPWGTADRILEDKQPAYVFLLAMVDSPNGSHTV